VTAAVRMLPRPLGIMVAATIAVGMVSPLDTIFGSPGIPARGSVIWPVLGVALVALQLRHSLAAARGERPRAGGWTLLAMAVLVYAPLPWLTYIWLPTQPMFMASALMVLRPPILARSAAAVPAIGTALYFPLIYPLVLHITAWHGLLFETGFWGISLPMGAAVIYGAARMVRGARELQAAQAELAELVIAQERLRIGRDLHDLIGQSLAAVSLRGDLAVRLVNTDPAAAEAEIATLTATARLALHDILMVTSDSPGADLQSEADGAKALLAAASIDTTINIDPDALTLHARTVFGWALREGVTNVLRHSEAAACSITITSGPDGAAALEIVNDGVRQPASQSGPATGSGLIGLTERARALGGELTAGPVAGGLYRLRVEIPGEG
jgi:two-component system, NarL family, sensor histidine kinase DesK